MASYGFGERETKRSGRRFFRPRSLRTARDFPSAVAADRSCALHSAVLLEGCLSCWCGGACGKYSPCPALDRGSYGPAWVTTPTQLTAGTRRPNLIERIAGVS